MPLASENRGDLRWAILALISVSHIIGAAAQYGINTLAPFYQQDLQLTRAQIGLFFTAFYLGMAGLSLAAGWWTDRIGVRATALGGHLVLGFFTMIAALSPTFAWAWASFFLAGLGYSFLNPASTKGVMTWFNRDERATAMGIKQTGVPAGGVVTAVVGPILVWLAGWRGALAGLGAINILFGGFFYLFWREPESEPGAVGGPRSTPPALKGLSSVPSLLAVSFGTAVLLVAQMSLLTYIPLFLNEAIGLSAYRASLALALAQIGAMVGRIGWGIISDRFFLGKRKGVLLLIGALSIVLSLTLGWIPPGSSLLLVIPLVFLAGLSMVGYQGVSYTLIAEIAGTARTGSAMGLMITLNSVGAIFGTPFFGYLVDRTGSYATAWQSLAAAILLGMVALGSFLREPVPGSSASL